MGPLTTLTDMSDLAPIINSSLNRDHGLQSGIAPTPGRFGNGSPQSFEPADSLNSSTSPSKTLDPTTSSSCQCMQTALGVLEALETDNNPFSPSAFDHILRLKKNAISQCVLMLRCQACSAASAFVMVLIIICEKILISFEKWSTRYQGRKPQPSQISDLGVSSETNEGKVKKFFLGVYEVDSEHEQCSLLRSLAMVQLRHLHRLLVRLKEFAACRKWAAHQALLASFVVRLEEAAAGLIARESVRWNDWDRT